MADETFSDRVEQWRQEAPERAARRAQRGRLARTTGKLIGVGALLALAVVVLLVLGLVVAFLAAAWKPALGFLIGAIVIGGISIGVRKAR